MSFFRGVPADEVLRCFGTDETVGREMAFEVFSRLVREFVVRTGGGNGSGYVGVIQVGGWSVALEPNGWWAACEMEWLSQGGEFVGIVTRFDPGQPCHRWGSDPDRLNGPMTRAGFAVAEPSDGEYEKQGIEKAFAVAAELTGVAFSKSRLDRSWFVGKTAYGW